MSSYTCIHSTPSGYLSINYLVCNCALPFTSFYPNKCPVLQSENIPKDYRIRVRYISKDVVSLTNTQTPDQLTQNESALMNDIRYLIPTIYRRLQTDRQPS